MPDYSIYVMDHLTKRRRPARAADYEDDRAALVATAAQMVPGTFAEVWQADRLVGSIRAEMDAEPPK